MIKKLPPYPRRLSFWTLSFLLCIGFSLSGFAQSPAPSGKSYSIADQFSGQRTPGGQAVTPPAIQRITAERSVGQSFVGSQSNASREVTRGSSLSYLNLSWNQPVLRHAAQPPYAAARRSWSGSNNLPTAAAGACDTILYEDFQSKLIPAAWTNLDLDNNPDANGRPLNWYIDDDPQSTVAGDTNWTAHSSSWFTSVAQANNWLILPQIQICDPGVELIWKSAPNEGPGYLDGYEVLISTTGNAPANFTTTLATFAEDISGTGAGTLGTGTAHTNYNGIQGVLEEWSVPLGAYNGQNVYIAFRHTSTDDNLIRLDDIFIGLLTSFDLATTAIGGNEYTVTPLDHVAPLNYVGIVENLGSSAATTPTLTVDVTSGGSSVFTTNASIATLPSGDDTLLTMATAHTPGAVATYRASFESSLAQGDLNPANDTLSFEYDVSANTYSRDNGILAGNLSIGTATAGVLGQEYDLLVGDTLTSVEFFLDAPDLGDTVYAVVYSMGATEPNALLATSDALIVPSATGATYTLNFPGGVPLAAGTYMVGLLETVAGSVSLGYSADIFSPGRTWTFFNNAWNNSENFNFFPAYMLRPSFGTPPVAGPCADTLLFEDFQSQTIPATWTNLDLDGLTDANARPQDWYVTVDLETTVGTDTNYVGAASSWFSPAGTANNWLILPQITVCDTNIDLFWKSAPFEGPAFMDGYNVRISTTGNAPADFTTVLAAFAEDVSGTGAGTPGPGIVHTSFNGNRGVLQQWSADLSSFNGQSVYIAFEHTSNDDNLILLDDIFIGREIGGDVAVNEAATSSEYSVIPLAQVQPMTFEGRVANNSSDDATNILLDLQVIDNGAVQHTDNASLPVLAGFSDSLLSLTSVFVPVDTGVHFANFSVSATGNDPDSTNNNLTVEFEISDTVYARDNGVGTGSLSIGAGSEGILGQEFDIIAATNLTSATFELATGDVGDTIEVVLYTMGATSPNAQIASTGLFIVPTTGQGTYTVPFPSPVALNPGAYFLGVVETAANATTLVTTDNIFTEDRTWVFFNNAWSNSEDFNFLVAYALRANVSAGCALPVASFSSTTNSLSATFSNTSTGGTSALWDFGDGNLSTLGNPTHTYANSGTYTVCLTVTDSCGTDSSCSSVTVNCAAPATAFSNSASNLMVNFTDVTSGAPTAWFWDFGDGNTSTMQNPTHNYANTGSYLVCLTTTNACGSDSSCSTVAVTCPAPGASFTSNVNNLVVDFTDATTGTPTSWSWDFGDGNISMQQNPSHTYTVPGTYLVCLTTVNACGSDSSCSSFTVTCAAPAAAWTFSQLGGGLAYSFSDNSTATGTAGYVWTFGDGTVSTQQNPTHTYAVSGSYTVCLTVTDLCGSDSMCMSLTVVNVEGQLSNAIQVYPNPAQEVLRYNIDLDYPEALELTLFNALGQIVIEKDLGELSQGQGHINTENLQDGFYYLRVKGSRTNEVHTVRVAH